MRSVRLLIFTVKLPYLVNRMEMMYTMISTRVMSPSTGGTIFLYRR